MQTTIIPHTQKPLVSRTYPSQSELEFAIQNASKAQKIWRNVPLKDRVDISCKFIVCSSPQMLFRPGLTIAFIA